MTTNKARKGAVVDTGAMALLSWWAFEMACWFALGLVGITVLWLLHDPWLNVGEFLVGSTNAAIPGASLVAKIPFIGGVISGAMVNTVNWVATVAMAIMNVIQVLAMLSGTGYLTLKPKWVSILTWFAMGSWVIELLVALLEHSVYVGGWAGFVADLPIPTFSYFRMGAIVSVILLMFLFEVSIYVGAICVLAMRNNKSRSQAKARAKAAGAGANNG
jgi:hypothetical protein